MFFKKYKEQIKELMDDKDLLTADLIKQRNKIKLLESQKEVLIRERESLLKKEKIQELKLKDLEDKLFEREQLRRKAASKLGGLVAYNKKLKEELTQSKQEFVKILEGLNKENQSLKNRLQPPKLSDLQYPRNKKLKNKKKSKR